MWSMNVFVYLEMNVFVYVWCTGVVGGFRKQIDGGSIYW